MINLSCPIFRCSLLIQYILAITFRISVMQLIFTRLYATLIARAVFFLFNICNSKPNLRNDKKEIFFWTCKSTLGRVGGYALILCIYKACVSNGTL